MKYSYKELEREIKENLKVNIFKKSRERKFIDARSLYCYILRKDYKYTLQEIISTFKENGLERNHATILHSVKIYEVSVKYDPDLDRLRKRILNPIQPQVLLLDRIREIKDVNRLNGINNFINFQEEQIN
jgi:hypothetical protein